MNLHNIVRSAITSINPDQTITLKKFLSDVIDEFGKVVNTFEESEVIAQIQPVSSEKLQHLNNFNTSNTYQKVFLNGLQNGLSQPLSTNGDSFIIDNKEWLIVEAPQQWKYSGWNSLIISLQA